jgi:small subunit ribosomal protein S20
LANIKSQIKRNRQNEKRRVRNRTFRGAARTAVANAREAFTQNDPNTKEAVMKAISMLDKAARQGVLHPNNAARRKGRLMKKLAAFKPSETPVEEKKAKKASPKKAAPKKAAAKKSE